MRNEGVKIILKQTKIRRIIWRMRLGKIFSKIKDGEMWHDTWVKKGLWDGHVGSFLGCHHQFSHIVFEQLYVLPSACHQCALDTCHMT